MTPEWFGRRYPTLQDLEDDALKLSVPVLYGRCVKPGMVWDLDGPLCIAVPGYAGNLAKCWAVAHELGHLHLHHGRATEWLHDKREEEASAWAARALIPVDRVRRYKNASLDAFIAALWRNYEEFPVGNSGVRMLAAAIAHHRLKYLEKVI